MRRGGMRRNLTKKVEEGSKREERDCGEGWRKWMEARTMNNRVGLSELCDAARC